MNLTTDKGKSIQTFENRRQTGASNKPVFSSWPFTPASSANASSQSPGATSLSSRAGGTVGGANTKNQLTRGTMVADICLVVVWGATIPGLMWLGTLGGF